MRLEPPGPAIILDGRVTMARRRGRPRMSVERRRDVPRAEPRIDDGNAFLPDGPGGPAVVDDDLAECWGEDYVLAATTGEDLADEVLQESVPEELGGPFVESTAREEYGWAPDE